MRRRFSSAYKLRILAEVEDCGKHERVGEILRREQLYSSHLTQWRQQRDKGLLNQGIAGDRKRSKRIFPALQAQQLEKKNRTLRHEIKLANRIIDAQKSLMAVTTGKCADSVNWRDEIMRIAEQLGDYVGVGTACDVLQIPQDTLLRHISASEHAIR